MYGMTTTNTQGDKTVDSKQIMQHVVTGAKVAAIVFMYAAAQLLKANQQRR